MIHPSRRWRFIQEIEDAGYFEDDIVQHIVTEHRALRRSFSDKFSADETAVAAVTEQLSLAAKCNPPALPIIYEIETVKGRLTFLTEYIEGIDVAYMVRKKEFTKPRQWVRFAIKLVDELLLLRRAGARFEKLPIEHLLLTETEELRIRHRFPVGILDPETVAKSRFLQRFEIEERGGVYTSPTHAGEAAELWTVRDILLKAAAANTTSTFDELRQEVLDAPDRHSSPLARIDSQIAEFLFRINVGTGSADICTLDQLQPRLSAFLEEMLADARGEQTALLQAAAPQSAPAKPAVQRPDNTGNPFHQPPPAPQNVDESPAVPSFAGAAPAAKPRAKAAPPAHAKVRPDLPPPPTDDDFANPFTMGAGGPPATTKATVAKSSDDSPKQAFAAPKSPRKPILSAAMVRRVGIIAGAVVVAGVIIAVVRPMFNRAPKDTTPPVAVLADPSPREARTDEKIMFDATGSHDDVATTLSYQWQIASPEGSTALFGVADGQVTEADRYLTRSPKIFIQFLSLGDYELVLQTNDGKFFSDPVTVKIAVTR